MYKPLIYKCTHSEQFFEQVALPGGWEGVVEILEVIQLRPLLWE